MTWTELCRIAEETVDQTRQRLPVQIRGPATKVPVTMHPFPEGELLDEENVEPDILGYFVGPSFADADRGGGGLPPQILLFLENLWDFADGDPVRYRDEVRVTFLHELGHYFGWDEDEVAARGLE